MRMFCLWHQTELIAPSESSRLYLQSFYKNIAHGLNVDLQHTKFTNMNTHTQTFINTSCALLVQGNWTKRAYLLPLCCVYFYCSTGQKCYFLSPKSECKTGPFRWTLVHVTWDLWDAGTDFSLLDSKETVNKNKQSSWRSWNWLPNLFFLKNLHLIVKRWFRLFPFGTSATITYHLLANSIRNLCSLIARLMDFCVCTTADRCLMAQRHHKLLNDLKAANQPSTWWKTRHTPDPT